MHKRMIAVLLLLMIVTLCGCGSREKRDREKRYPNVSQEIRSAEEFRDGQNYAVALETYLQALEQNPSSVDALLGAAECQIHFGNYEVAAYDLDAAVLLDPGEPRIAALASMIPGYVIP